VDAKGREWQLVRRIRNWAERNELQPYDQVNVHARAADDWSIMTDEELAERMRPVKLIGDAEYVRASLDVESIRVMRAHIANHDIFRGRPWRGADNEMGAPGIGTTTQQLVASSDARANSLDWLFGTGAGLSRSPQSDAWVAESLQDITGPTPTYVADPFRLNNGRSSGLRAISGSDNRVLYIESTAASYPFRAAVNISSGIGQAPYLNPPTNTIPNPWYGWLLPTGCSATMIGEYTAITAAHCFWDRTAITPQTPNGAYYRNQKLFSAVVTRKTYSSTWANPVISSQWKHFGPISSTDSAYGHPNPPVGVTVKSAYLAGSTNVYDDVAVIDFFWYAGRGPGYHLGVIPPGISDTASDYTGQPAAMFGYDWCHWGPAYNNGSGTCYHPPSDYPNANYFAPPSFMGRASPVGSVRPSTVSPSANSMFWHGLDTTAGASGSGIRQQIFNSAYHGYDATYYLVGVHHGAEDWTSECPVSVQQNWYSPGTNGGGYSWCNAAARYDWLLHTFVKQSTWEYN
jgi:hypothetical protein